MNFQYNLCLRIKNITSVNYITEVVFKSLLMLLISGSSGITLCINYLIKNHSKVQSKLNFTLSEPNGGSLNIVMRTQYS